jgi:hypothetical protein
MPPTDRGIVVVRTNADGTTNIDICASVKTGRPVGTFAQYVGIPSKLVHVEVPLQRAGDVGYTDSVVEVVPSERGDIYIRSLVSSGAGL